MGQEEKQVDSFLEGLKRSDIAFDEAMEYIEYRREHNSNLATRWPILNSRLMGGLAPNTILTVGGISGCGKTSFVSMMEQDLFDKKLNGHHKVSVLDFSLEMLIRNQITRKLSSLLHISTRNILSVDEKIDEKVLQKCREQKDIFSEMDIYYYEGFTDVEKVYNISREFIEANDDRWVVIILDHTLLVEGPGEIVTIKELQKTWNMLKRMNKTTIIQVSQLNRNIEDVTRKRNWSLMYPQKSDFSTSDSMFQISDYVIALHRPEIMGLKRYGPPHYDCIGKAYAHILKNREGELSLTGFITDLAHNNLIEMTDRELDATKDAKVEVN